MTKKLLYFGFIATVLSVVFISCKQQDASSGKSSVKEVYLSMDGKFTVDTLAKGLAIPLVWTGCRMEE